MQCFQSKDQLIKFLLPYFHEHSLHCSLNHLDISALDDLSFLFSSSYNTYFQGFLVQFVHCARPTRAARCPLLGQMEFPTGVVVFIHWGNRSNRQCVVSCKSASIGAFISYTFTWLKCSESVVLLLYTWLSIIMGCEVFYISWWPYSWPTKVKR